MKAIVHELQHQTVLWKGVPSLPCQHRVDVHPLPRGEEANPIVHVPRGEEPRRVFAQQCPPLVGNGRLERGWIPLRRSGHNAVPQVGRIRDAPRHAATHTHQHHRGMFPRRCRGQATRRRLMQRRTRSWRAPVLGATRGRCGRHGRGRALVAALLDRRGNATRPAHIHRRRYPRLHTGDELPEGPERRVAENIIRRHFLAIQNLVLDTPLHIHERYRVQHRLQLFPFLETFHHVLQPLVRQHLHDNVADLRRHVRCTRAGRKHPLRRARGTPRHLSGGGRRRRYGTGRFGRRYRPG